MKKLLITSILLSTATCVHAGTFGDVYSDFYQHDSQTFGIEGGYSNQDLNAYAFSEMSSVGSNFTKGSLLYAPSHIYIQSSYFKQGNFTDTATVVGSGYQYNFAGISLQPFAGVIVGKHESMIGWNASASIGNVTLSHWNETVVNLSNTLNSQGAVGAFYNITPRFGTGLQYRYYWNMDHTHHFNGNFIYRIYYNL